MATNVQDFLKANPRYVGRSNTSNRAVATMPASKKGTGKLGKNGLSAWISELAGSGGALGGAAAGAALGSVVPGIGNVIGGVAGGLVGGFAGGFGGRAAENKLRDDEYRLGDSLKEGAVSGIFGAVGPAFQGARGLGALGKAAGGKGIASGVGALSNLGDDAAKIAAGKAIAKNGARAGRAIGQGLKGADLAYASRGGLQAAGGQLRGMQRGIIGGNNGITRADRLGYNQAMDSANKWFSGIGKSGQFENADDAMKALTNQYKRAPEAAKAFGTDNADLLGERFLANLDSNPVLKNTITGKNSKIVNSLLDDALGFSKKKNADFVEYMSSKINPRYRTVSSGGSAGSVESQILEAFRDAGKSVIDEKLVTRSGVNKQFANLLGASKELGKTITRDTGAGVGQGTTVSRIASNVLGPAMDVAGRVMQQAGRVTQVTTPLVTGALSRGTVNQAAAPVPTSEVQAPQEDTTLYGSMAGSEPQYTPTMGAGEIQGDTGTSYTLEQAMADITRDPKNAATYKWVYEQSMKTGEGAQLSAQEKKSQKQAQTAMQGLTQLKQLFSSAGGGQNRLPGILGNIQGKVGGNSKADSYNKIRDSLTTSLARAFGETGVLTDQDREVYKQALPRLEDTPEEAQIKLQYLEDMLAGSSQSYNTDYGTQSDLSSIISQYGGM